MTLYSGVRALSSTMTFASGVSAMIEAMLQSPEFLYRVELGTAVSGNSAVRRIAGREMATRLSYMFWQTMPDATLFQAADAGTLDTNDGVRQQAQKLLEDSKSHPTVAFFFDNLLPIPDLSGLTRDVEGVFVATRLISGNRAVPATFEKHSDVPSAVASLYQTGA